LLAASLSRSPSLRRRPRLGCSPSKNGRLIVPGQTATGTSSAQFLADFSCPNPNWTPEVTATAISFVYTLTFDGFTQPAIIITG
jgi:hypothetical protein